MAKVPNLHEIKSGFASASALNDNFQMLQDALETFVSRDGETPNHMLASFDMNGQTIINLPEATSDTEPVRYKEFLEQELIIEDLISDFISEANSILSQTEDARDDAIDARDDAIAASTSAQANEDATQVLHDDTQVLHDDTALLYDDTAHLYDDFRSRFYGSAASDPTEDPNGEAPTLGDIYYNTETNSVRFYTNTGWADAATVVDSALGAWAFREDISNVALPSGATSYQLTNDQERAAVLVFSGAPADGCEIFFNNERNGPWTVLSATQNEATLMLKGDAGDEGVELVSSFPWFIDPSNTFRARNVLNNTTGNAILDLFAEGAYNDIQQSGEGLLLREDGDGLALKNVVSGLNTIIDLEGSGGSYELSSAEQQAGFLSFLHHTEHTDITLEDDGTRHVYFLTNGSKEHSITVHPLGGSIKIELPPWDDTLSDTPYYRAVYKSQNLGVLLPVFSEATGIPVQPDGVGRLLREDGDARNLTNLPIRHEGFIVTDPNSPNDGHLLLDKSGRLTGSLSASDSIAGPVKVSPDGTMFAIDRSSGGTATTLRFRVYSLVTGEVLIDEPDDGAGNIGIGLAWSPDSSELYVQPGGSGTTVYVYDATDWSAAPSTFTADTGSGSHPIDVSADNTRIVIGGDNGAFLFRVSDKEQLAQLTTNSCIAAKISRDSSKVAVGRFSGEGNLQVFDTSDPYSEISATIPAIGTEPRDLAWSPGDDYVVLTHNEDPGNSLTLLRVTGFGSGDTWVSEDGLPASLGTGQQAAFTDDGQFIFQTYRFGCRLISMETGQDESNIYSPDGASFNVFGQPTPRDSVARSTVTWQSAGGDKQTVNYQVTTKELDEGFEGGTVKFTRIQDTVTVTSGTLDTVPTASVLESSSGFVPAEFRPTTNIVIVDRFTSQLVREVLIEPAGRITMTFRDPSDGTSVSRQSTGAFSFTYNVV